MKMSSKLAAALVMFCPGFSHAEQEPAPRRNEAPQAPPPMYNGRVKPHFGEDRDLDDGAFHLSAMDEPIVRGLEKDKAAFVLRFTCRSTFDHVFTIRLAKVTTGYVLTRKVADWRGGWAPTNRGLKETSWTRLTEAEVAPLLKLLAETEFMKQAPHEEKRAMLDGSDWVVEVVKDGAYQVVQRNSPEGNQPIAVIGNALVAAAMWTPEKRYMKAGQ
jgi:hypothetical protein